MAQRVKRCECKRDWLWIRSPLEEMKYLTVSFLRSDDEAKRGVECHHSTRYASRIRRRMESGIS